MFWMLESKCTSAILECQWTGNGTFCRNEAEAGKIEIMLQFSGFNANGSLALRPCLLSHSSNWIRKSKSWYNKINKSSINYNYGLHLSGWKQWQYCSRSSIHRLVYRKNSYFILFYKQIMKNNLKYLYGNKFFRHFALFRCGRRNTDTAYIFWMLKRKANFSTTLKNYFLHHLSILIILHLFNKWKQVINVPL